MLRTIAAAAVLLCAGPAFAGMNGPCFDKKVVASVMAKEGKAITVFGSLAGNDGETIALFLGVNPDGDWTLAMSPDGRRMCVIAEGAGWTPVEPPEPGQGA